MKHFDPERRSFGMKLISLATLVGAAASLTANPRPAEARTPHSPAPVNVVVQWNSVAEAAFTPSQGTNPMSQSRTLAILHASMHDALNAIDRRYASYTPGLPKSPKASAEAAVAAASREVLVRLLPEQAALVETAYGQALKALPDGAAKTAGIALGQAAAWATMNRRQNDGADGAFTPYVPRPGAGEYQFTAPFDFAGAPGWGNVTPFVIKLADHALQGPLPLTSERYAKDLAIVREIGEVSSPSRSAEQTEIAKFWYEDSPLGWNRIANTVVRERRLDAWDAARAFTLLHFAMADGFIAGFGEKYAHRFWRPVTAIQAAATDGNPHTEPVAGWQPLLVTPPVPDYPSTHTVLGWSAAEVLIELFGDKQRYSLTSLTLPNVTRHFRGFSQAAHENGLSRLYAGIHFPYAIQEGRRQGRSIGQVVSEALPRVR
jgi:hypothetical protein